MGGVCVALIVGFGIAVAILAQPFVIGLAILLALIYAVRVCYLF
jgi:hypothetical protein